MSADSLPAPILGHVVQFLRSLWLVPKLQRPVDKGLTPFRLWESDAIGTCPVRRARNIIPVFQPDAEGIDGWRVILLGSFFEPRIAGKDVGPAGPEQLLVERSAVVLVPASKLVLDFRVAASGLYHQDPAWEIDP